MSDTVTTPPKPNTPRAGSDDGRILAQVEKWLETIREISREPAKDLPAKDLAEDLAKDLAET
jgi:hypothetical protein